MYPYNHNNKKLKLPRTMRAKVTSMTVGFLITEFTILRMTPGGGMSVLLGDKRFDIIHCC